MRTDLSHLSRWRLREGRMWSDDSHGGNGAFVVPYKGIALQIIASDGMGWDHVSVVPVDSKNGRKLFRTPTWAEMCFAKELFFGDEETVIEFHPPKRLYRNAHEYCLHLWRPQGVELPLPNPMMVAPEGSIA